MSVVRLKPYQFIHVHDNNTSVTRVLVGPQTYTCYDHEATVQKEPQQCIAIPPGCYCTVKNPVARDAKTKQPVVSDKGLAKVRIGDVEIRFAQEPFPLFPGEELSGDVRKMDILTPLQAFRCFATRDFYDEERKVKRAAGEEWMVHGPCTYVPRIEVDVMQKVDATVVDHSTAVKLRAIADFTDRNGIARRTGEEWLHEEPGAFIPDVCEAIVEVVKAVVLTDTRAIHVRALVNFTDDNGKDRRAGEQWLVTSAVSPTFIPSPHEVVAAKVNLVTVGAYQYAIVNDYVDANGDQVLGRRQLRTGNCSFFLHPGENLEGGKVKDMYLLGDDEGLVLFADQDLTDDAGAKHKAGDRWMIYGPQNFIPQVEVTVEERRKAIPLDRTEGVYIRDKRTGHVRAHIGSTVMLTAHEELWNKVLPPLVEELLANPRLTKVLTHQDDKVKVRRQPWQVVSCNVPHNQVVQVYDYQRKKARVIAGPELVSLQPDEEFTVVSISGGKPKQSDVIKTLALHLGPDFMTDVLLVETKDHARLQLQLSYNWEFDTSRTDLKERLFNVPDFVGDACKAIASRVRGAAAAESFDAFHRNSTTIIRRAVFGAASDFEPLRFESNGLVITSVDIHSVDPADPKTRDALQKSVQLAIEITTKQQEASARHEAVSKEQAAHGKLERQIIGDKAKAEVIRKSLLGIEAENAAVESTGASKAAAKAQAEAKAIEGETEVQVAELHSKAETVMMGAEIDVLKMRHENTIDHMREINELEIHKQRTLAEIEAEKFKKTINAIGKETILSLAQAGPALQAKLLGALGLQGYLVTDGTNPINLFNTAKGMANQGAAAAASATMAR